MEFSENELASMICDNDEDVNEALYKKYSYLVTIVINKNKNILIICSSVLHALTTIFTICN